MVVRLILHNENVDLSNKIKLRDVLHVPGSNLINQAFVHTLYRNLSCTLSFICT